MLHLPSIILDLALILGAAAMVSLLFKKLKQPLVLGYIIAGLLVGPNFKMFPTILEVDTIRIWADIGVIFLLFSLGLEFSFKKLIKVGAVAVITAFTEVTLTMVLGYGLGRLMGWDTMNSLFLGGILAIASTTIIIRAFDELGVKNQKFTHVVTGVLVIEDLVAVLLMVLLTTVAVGRTFSGAEMMMSVLKLAFFLILWFVSGIFFLPSILKKIQSSLTEETLLIISLALCLLMVVLATYVGFSPALGAFIMGSILAETTKAEKISHLTKSVKNLFGAIFFVSVGMLINPQMLKEHALPIIAATLVLLIGKPFFVCLGALASGQPLKIAVQSGMSLSQIGEFSFIIATLGLSLKVTSEFLYPVAVAVSVLTTFTTPYMIRLSGPAYNYFERIMPHRWKDALHKYSATTQNMAEISDWKKILKFYAINVVLFSVIILTIILLSTRFMMPFFNNLGWNPLITVIVTLVFLAPFLWALAFRRTQKQAYANVWLNATYRGPLFVLLVSRMVLALVYIGFLFDQIYSPLVAFVGVSITCLILLLFSQRIKLFYSKIEKRFLENYHERENQSSDPRKILAPWDTHIATFLLDARSPYVGKTLAESRIREEFGVNIVVIDRGDYIINVPSRNKHLYPNDKLSVIGTDEQLKKFEKHLEASISNVLAENTSSRVVLHHFTISPNSCLVGQSIVSSKIRERTNGLVVGIERDGNRILNPDSSLYFEINDKVWIVGNEKQLQAHFNEFTGC